MLLVFFYVVTTLMSLVGPYAIKELIGFVKTGKNAWNITWDPFFFSEETEYGLLLVSMLVSSQAITYFVSEHISYYQSKVAALASSALVGLVYEKTLKISLATNKRFKSGDLISFI